MSHELDVNKLVAAQIVEDKSGLIAVLRKNGIVIKNDISDSDLAAMTFIGITRSSRIRADLSELWASCCGEEYANAGGKAAKPKPPKVNPNTKKAGGQGTRVGNILRGLATPENANTVLNSGLQLYGAKLAAKADKGTIDSAVDLEVAQTNKLIQQQKAGGKKWLMPVVIGGVLLAAIGAYFYFKKK